MSDFVQLHLHTEYSLLDGACRIKDIPSRLKDIGQTACAITDHGVMYGCVQFYKELRANGIKPIIGCEIYVAPQSRYDRFRVDSSAYHHLVLLCKNEIGYKNLIKIVSKAFTEGFYTKPRADIDLLREHNEGLIALSGCLGGCIPQKIMAEDYEGAKAHALLLEEIFGKDNFYLEIQDHGIEAEKKVSMVLKRMSKETGIPLVATNDAHYLSKDDAGTHKVLTSIQTNNSLEFETDEFYVKSYEEMYALFSDVPEALENTVKIAEKCTFDFEFDKMFLPAFVPEDGSTAHDYFIRSCNEGLERRRVNAEKLGEIYNMDEYRERLDMETKVIVNMGFVEYFLIVADYVNFAKSKGIPVGPGRGSGAGSLAAYCLGITDVDPIKYNLLFERFLNPERVSMPDFDVDFCYERRTEVIDYVSERYGRERVTQIITFGTMAARAAIRDTARALEIPYADADVVAKLIPRELNITLDKALEEVPELATLYKENDTVKRLVDVARKLEGMPRNSSTHAAAVVISDKSVDEYVPLSLNGGVVVTQYNMNEVAELGLLKMDFLGLRNLTIIHNAEERIRQTEPDFDIENVPLDDEATFRMLSEGGTEGVFQLESGGMRSLIMRLEPRSIEDITAAISLYRPGPMDSIPKYIENRKNPSRIRYADERLKAILDVTNGCVVYQEQVMQIFRVLAGYSYGRADVVRRYMSKKKVKEMEKEKEYFLYGKKREDGSTECEGAIARGVKEQDALKIYDEMSEFAKYAFNKSHACAYSVVAYRTAYLKCHYPREYMSALITSVLDSETKVASYIAEIGKQGIKVLPPSVNHSGIDFTVEGSNIRFGLLAIKNIGRSVLEKIIGERNLNGEYKSLEDFLVRTADFDVYEKVVENLIKSGAFDCFGKKRSQLVCVYSTAIKELAKSKSSEVKGQIDLFSQLSDSDGTPSRLVIEYPDVQELTLTDRLLMEKEVAGIYFSGHPLLEYTTHSAKLGAATVEEINASFGDDGTARYSDGQKVVIVAMLKNCKVKQTKNNARMVFADCDDITGSMEVIIFPKVLETYSAEIYNGNIAAFSGKISVKESREQVDGKSSEEAKLILENVFPVYKNGTPEAENASPSEQTQTTDRAVTRQNGNANQRAYTRDENTNPAPGAVHATDSNEPVFSLFLKMKSDACDEYKKCVNLFEIFDYGNTPVFILFESGGKLVKYSATVNLNNTLVFMLKRILGETAVVIKKKV
ncbi:MAG: DNA polymerase III subunit alpha [Clostridia bacterium]|nr:DNA polymerase III subunit alpha [Clostridia bacterium]